MPWITDSSCNLSVWLRGADPTLPSGMSTGARAGQAERRLVRDTVPFQRRAQGSGRISNTAQKLSLDCSAVATVFMLEFLSVPRRPATTRAGPASEARQCRAKRNKEAARDQALDSIWVSGTSHACAGHNRITAKLFLYVDC